MPKSFKPRLNLKWKPVTRDPQHAVRAVLGVLLLANLVAAWFVFQTPGGTVEQLESDVAAKRKQLIGRQASLERMKKLVDKSTMALESGDQFLAAFFLPRKNAYSLLEVDLANASKLTGIRAKERSYSYEPIEGTDTLGMLNIVANFEGTYADLIELVNHIDRSKRLLIIDQLQAQPQQGSNMLNVSVRMNAFFRMEGPEASEEESKLVQVGVTPTLAEAPKPVQTPPVRMQSAQSPAGPKTTVIQAPPQTVSEPRSGPLPVPPRKPTFRRPPQREEEK